VTVVSGSCLEATNRKGRSCDHGGAWQCRVNGKLRRQAMGRPHQQICAGDLVEGEKRKLFLAVVPTPSAQSVVGSSPMLPPPARDLGCPTGTDDGRSLIEPADVVTTFRQSTQALQELEPSWFSALLGPGPGCCRYLSISLAMRIAILSWFWIGNLWCAA